jgi:hypothetical protein
MADLGYECLLDDQPSILAPRRALERRREAVGSAQSLVVNPSARILPLDGAGSRAAARLCLLDHPCAPWLLCFPGSTSTGTVSTCGNAACWWIAAS